jgi:hypothetical protein
MEVGLGADMLRSREIYDMLMIYDLGWGCGVQRRLGHGEALGMKGGQTISPLIRFVSDTRKFD